MGKSGHNLPAGKTDSQLFDGIVTILEEARGNLVRAVNTQMVTAYWLIGREIVEELQGGEERAEYGKQVIEGLSIRLTERYGSGFSTTNLKYFRLFYQAYPDRLAGIRHPTGDELSITEKLHPTGGELSALEKQHPTGVEFDTNKAILSPAGRELAPAKNQYPAGTKSLDAPISSPSGRELIPLKISYPTGDQSGDGFLPELSWSHYRVLMRVDDPAVRDFYEREAAPTHDPLRIFNW